MGNTNKPKLKQSDYELFYKINKFGYVDFEYINRYMYPGIKDRSKKERINQLVKHNYLVSLKTFIPVNYTISYREGYRILTLGPEGLALLNFLGIETENNIKKLENSSPYRSYHQCQVVSSVETFILNYTNNEDTNFEYVTCYNEKDCYNGEIYMQPDAAIVFRHKTAPDSYVVLFIELERGYSSSSRIKKKLLNYKNAFDKKIYSKLFNINILQSRILFISQTEEQIIDINKKIKAIDKTKDLKVLSGTYQTITNDPLGSNYHYFNDETKKFKIFEELN